MRKAHKHKVPCSPPQRGFEAPGYDPGAFLPPPRGHAICCTHDE
ncbi:hypothetical protein QO019_001912 [Streptomyces thermodiastaticus]|uniref:Uncharacterized protein n=1 Tax=Streptomyces thermodiastaticus TaxID=44061 RepID=A0ABU0KCG2_9ACTN|nr:hypothetical protein [Streptomyces thermodiastaticus]